nr:hypothetical protein CFP56_59378 [Quercus suber]
MPHKRSRVTLAQILDAPGVPQSQTPTPTTTVRTRVTRAGSKRPRGSNSEQQQTIPDSENSPPHMGDTHVEDVGAPAYIMVFVLDGEALPAIDRVRPWRDGRGGKVAECVGKALLLPEDMKHWAKWDDETLLLNMKREAVMGYQCSAVIEERFLAFRAKAKKMNTDNEDLLKKICGTINKVSESEKLRAEAEENNKAITERKEAL